jgi:hypothetical protein
MTAPDEATITPQRRCSICADRTTRAKIDTLIASGMRLMDIEEETRKAGIPRKRETIGRHYRLCLGSSKPVLTEDMALTIGESGKGAKTDAERDFAILVQKRATELLAAGAMKVTASHGLQAQALLDRRAEKQADRDLALNMARLLSGAMEMAPMHVVEGRAVDVTPMLLAPLDVVER